MKTIIIAVSAIAALGAAACTSTGNTERGAVGGARGNLRNLRAVAGGRGQLLIPSRASDGEREGVKYVVSHVGPPLAFWYARNSASYMT